MPSTRFRFTSLSGTLLGVLLAAGCAKPGPAGSPPAPQAAASRAPDPEAVARARADSLRNPYTEADIHFMSGMISHHAQAILIAGWAAERDASPSVRTLAARIINAQRDEIALMQQWLRERLQPVPEARPTGMKMVMNGVEHDMMMPGMLTPEQLEELRAARGPAFDRLFLLYMIQHHRGAVEMVKTLFDSHGAGQDEIVFKFASDVNVDQSTEIARMKSMLAALAGLRRAP
ncbi:MAG: DUF305 domain-containing protein [Gemmatimonadetes bacterium]|nr:DUF305 domain-containing protein [Gemmatimonadota bacterium]